MTLPSTADLAPLAEGTTVHVELPLPCRWGVVAKVHPAGSNPHGAVHDIRLEGGAYVRAYGEVLCAIHALPVASHCRGRWDFHPPVPGLVS